MYEVNEEEMKERIGDDDPFAPCFLLSKDFNGNSNLENVLRQGTKPKNDDRKERYFVHFGIFAKEEGGEKMGSGLL